MKILREIEFQKPCYLSMNDVLPDDAKLEETFWRNDKE